MVFKKYAQYYDSLYKEKNYAKECVLVSNTIRQYSEGKTIVDLGCGTGTHARILTGMGYDVIGIDQSANMIKQARLKTPDIKFIEGDITTFKLEKPVDIAVSLFHVVSYLTTIKKLDDFLQCVHKNIKNKGLLIFDVWCGHGVLTDPPTIRKKHIKDSVFRVATPKVNLGDQTVAITYTIEDGKKTIKETHIMRYFFKQELEMLLNNNGFDLVEITTLKPGTWNMYIVAVKR